ncbi:restriction endonuclease subunit S [Moritella viscosa]
MSSLIPNNWSITTLESNASLITDGSHFSPQTFELGKPIATVQNMRERHIDISSCRLISPDKFDDLVKGNCLPEYGDVLFSKDGTIGKTFVYKQKQPIVLLSSIAIIRLKQHLLNPDYCTQYLQSSLFYKQLENATSGSAIRRVVLKDIKQLELPTPPLPEQQKIAAILTSVDDVIERTQAQIDKLKDLKTGMMQELLTRGVGVDGKPHTDSKIRQWVGFRRSGIVPCLITWLREGVVILLTNKNQSTGTKV